MDHCRNYIFLLLFIIILLHSETSFAQEEQSTFITESLPQLKKLSADLNQNVLPLLALIKEYEKFGQVASLEVAKIIKPVSAVKETDNENSLTVVEVRLNEEYIIIDRHDQWYKIKTADNREGWVIEEDIQVIPKQQVDVTGNIPGKSRQESSALLSQMAIYKNNIDELYESASAVIKQVDEKYNILTTEQKNALTTDYATYNTYKEKIEKYAGYASRFLKPYESILIVQNAPQPSKVGPGDRFKGMVSADVGRSSYQNMNSNSTTSRMLAFNGTYQIDKFTKVNVALNHQNELMQTAFTNNTVEAGISRQFEDKLTLSSNVGYNNYNDKATDNNSFGQLRAGLNATYTPTRKASLFGNINFQSKNFSSLTENNYQGILYIFGTNLMPDDKNNIRFQIQGNSQFSDRDYLNFNQLSPQLIYTVKTNPKKSFSIGLNYEMLKFAATNDFSDYQKYKVDFRWQNNRSKKVLSKSLNLTYKQYPNNSLQDYFKLGYTASRRKGSLQDEKSSVSTFSPMLTIITQRDNNILTDYLDLRWDKTKTKPKGYFNSSIYSRLWNNIDMIMDDTSTFPDHFVDFYSEFGPYIRNKSDGAFKLTSLKIGFIVGGHIYFNFDEDYFLRNGNSLRAGLALSGMFKIAKGHLELAGSYEHSWILVKETLYNYTTGDVSYGDNLLRDPSSLQFKIDFRLPLYDNWDIHFNLSTYNIRTDATAETSINPVERKSNLRFFGGLIYRFAL
jgi:hypothetical protein